MLAAMAMPSFFFVTARQSLTAAVCPISAAKPPGRVLNKSNDSTEPKVNLPDESSEERPTVPFPVILNMGKNKRNRMIMWRTRSRRLSFVWRRFCHRFSVGKKR